MKNDATRNDRLKAALRDNLRRRKAQSRVRERSRPDASEPVGGDMKGGDMGAAPESEPKRGDED